MIKNPFYTSDLAGGTPLAVRSAVFGGIEPSGRSGRRNPLGRFFGASGPHEHETRMLILDVGKFGHPVYRVIEARTAHPLYLDTTRQPN